MLKVIIGVLIGLVIGGALVFYFFIGVPKAASVPGELIQPPAESGPPPGTAEIVLREQLFNTVLDTIFRDMDPPTFPLTAGGAAPTGQPCPSEIKLLREGSGVRTSVRFDANTLSAPIAFSGSYNSIFGCFQFTGWTSANLQLRFDPATQAVLGQLNVRSVNLDGINPLVGGIITPLVQNTLNSRVNPIMIVDGRQIAVSVPIEATDAILRANVTDVRAEVKDDALHLYVTYDFRGIPHPAQ
ncbi:MAG: hypothetical protein IT174_04685 [Acidobacteria bacterium]|nr:hypothetical protein [Acidobacteriota bacterium]